MLDIIGSIVGPLILIGVCYGGWRWLKAKADKAAALRADTTRVKGGAAPAPVRPKKTRQE